MIFAVLFFALFEITFSEFCTQNLSKLSENLAQSKLFIKKMEYFKHNNTKDFLILANNSSLYLADFYTSDIRIFENNMDAVKDFFIFEFDSGSSIALIQTNYQFLIYTNLNDKDTLFLGCYEVSTKNISVAFSKKNNTFYYPCLTSSCFDCSSNFYIQFSFKPIFLNDLQLDGNSQISKFFMDDIHQDLYIVINKNIFIYSVLDETIWLNFSAHSNSIDDLLILSSKNNNESEIFFSIVSIEYNSGCFYFWKPNFELKNRGLKINEQSNYIYKNCSDKITSSTTIFEKEYFVINYNKFNENEKIINKQIVYSFDLNYSSSASTNNHNSSNLQLMGNVDSLDVFFTYNLTHIEHINIFSDKSCDRCLYENLYFYPFSLGCSKICDADSVVGNYCFSQSLYRKYLNNINNINNIETYCDDNCEMCSKYNKSACFYCMSPNANSSTLISGACADSNSCFFYQYYNESSSQNQCNKCDNSSCQTCGEESKKCTSCSFGLFLLNNTCVKECKNPEYYSVTSYKDKYLTHLCLKNSTCYTWMGICYEDCPLGTYKYDTSNSCKPFCSEINKYTVEESNTIQCKNECIEPAYYNLTNDNIIWCIQKCPNKLFFDGDCYDVCPEGYYNADNLMCKSCPINCSSCISKTSCTKCKENNYIFENSATESIDCIYECPLGFFIFQDSCKKCGNFCENCSNEKNCITCENSYVLIDGNCTKCNENCKTCQETNANLCSSCEKSFFLFNSTCVKQCPSKTYQNSSSQQCENCNDSRCSNCSSGTGICLECDETFFLYNSSCTGNCPSKTYKNNQTKKCENCSDSNCLNCSSGASNCTSCENSLLYNSSCRSECPERTYENVNNKECKDCIDSHCFLCTNDYSCSICDETYFLNIYACVQSCSPHEYYNSSLRACLECEASCYNCYGSLSTNCISCKEPLYLKGSQCLHPCNFQSPCPVLNTTIVVSLQKSSTEKRAFFLVFSKDLEIPYYLNLNSMIDVDIENLDASDFSYSVDRVEGFNDRLKIKIYLNFSAQNPTVHLEFTNYSKTYLHGEFNTTFRLDNFTGYNISLETFIKPTEDTQVAQSKQKATSNSFDGLVGAVLALSIFSFLLNAKRLSLFWFLVDAMQLLTTIYFLNLNFSQRLKDCFKQMLFFHAFFFMNIGKKYDENTQTLKYFGREIYQPYSEKNYFQIFMSEKFLVNVFPALLIIGFSYFLILIFHLLINYNSRLFKFSEENPIWKLMHYIYGFFLFSLLIRVHFFFLYIIMIAIFLQFSHGTFETSFDSWNFVSALFILIYYGLFLAYIEWKIINKREIYEDMIGMEMYDPLFNALEVFSFVRRNHYIIIQFKKLLIVFLLAVCENSPKVFLAFLIILQVLSVLRQGKWRPFVLMKITLVNIITDLWVLMAVITLMKIASNDLGNATLISDDLIKAVESSGDATIVIIIVLLGVYFVLFSLMTLYLMYKNLDCLCYVCFNINANEFENEGKEEEENEDNPHLSHQEDSKNLSLDKSSRRLEDKDIELQNLNNKNNENK